MKFPGIELDNNSRPMICPNCNNEEIAPPGDYCMVCGVHLYNSCSSTQYDNNYVSEECKYPLPGNARYCPHCGAKSTYLNRGWLDPWDGNLASTNVFQQVDEDSLPF